ncbi:MAG: ATP-binding protein [Flavobacteriales bacterium]
MKTAHRYTLGGIAFGLAFPIISISFLLLKEKSQSIDLGLMHAEHPLLYIIDLAPIVLGFMAYIIGHKQQLYINQQLINTENAIRIKTQALREKNDILEKDIIERKKLEKNLKKATSEAIRARKTEQRFLANMSHEIRTPLNSILGFSRIFSEDNLNEKSKEYLKTIRFASSHLLSIVNDILDISKINAGKISFESKTIDLHKLINECINSVRVTNENPNLTIDYRIFTDEAIFIKTDPVRLNQVLFNLLNNAIKFTKNGEITLIIDKLNSQEKENTLKLKFRVQDTGIGIQEDKIKTIFENFTQAQTDTTREFGGTGLGLSITKKIVELQNGTVGVESEFGVGSTFWFEITYEIGNAQDLINNSISSLKQISPEKDINLLIAEDNEMNRFLIKSIFEEWSDYFVISFAHNGLDAFEQVKSNDYDLVIMDLQMPVKDGFESTEMIRALPAHKSNIPIIALTADVPESVKHKALGIGMNQFLTKPINLEELFPTIINCLQSEKKSK